MHRCLVFSILTFGAMFLPNSAYATPALLPMVDAVPETQAQPIDGLWTVSTIGKRVRIEKGRMHVVDPWRHLFILEVLTRMVVVKDIREQSPGVYTGYDLIALGAWKATKSASGALDVEVTGVLSTRFQMIPEALDDPSGYQQVPVQTQSTDPIYTAPPQAVDPPVTPALVPPIQPDPPAAQTPTVPDQEAQSGGVTCSEVIYQESTDDFKCVQ